MSQTLETRDGRSVLRMRRRLAHPPEKVWKALIEPERLAEWFPSTMDPELRVGGRVEFGFGTPGTVTELEEGRVIAYTWDTDHLHWEVRPDGDGSLLLLTHTFDDRPGAASFAAGWHTCVEGMDLLLSGGSAGDVDVDDRALHEQYVRELGIDVPDVRQAPDGWHVRLERQLTRPGAEVWADLRTAWPGAGAVLVADEPKALEQEAGGGRVRWELGEGTGHGARLTVTWTGPDPADRDTAADRVPALAARLSRP
ncbi:SRPBCC family protein [Pseudonocardia humida]|uniref:SRPBCC family protein n=1 Tax=Pseudonocardia humida TaxID=2800819 RepID=A0ABT0ZVF9_9PSEU|nr:SRPBCC family protein [Pseudonocardia humida]MCO1654721.1 SRPBCC family protein [Pseudonocardia humida]